MAVVEYAVPATSKSWSRLRLEQLLRIFRALQTSSVPPISMNARWRTNQLLIDSEWRVNFFVSYDMSPDHVCYTF